MSFYDIDKNGFDDVTLCTNGGGLHVNMNTDGEFEYYVIPIPGDIKSATWVDYDNDGDPDLFTTGNQSSCRLYNNDGTLNLIEVTDSLHLPATDVRCYGNCWGDYDNDGFLDLFIANYEFLNTTTDWLFHNNGNGSFTEVSAEAGIPFSSLFSFQGIWIDLDLDGDQDLYVITDKDLGNIYYENDGTGHFSVNESNGLDVNISAMCNSPSDYQADGDFDFYITNIEAGNYFMVNQDSMFVNQAEEMGVTCNLVAWGGLWIDMENDGDEDLHVGGASLFLGESSNFLFENQDDEFVLNESFLFDEVQTPTYASAKGDFNNDGKYDIVTAQMPINICLWRNDNPSENWMKVDLVGTASNTDGVGTIMRCYAGGRMTMRQKRFGENYLAQFSQHEIFGLGEAGVVDSLILEWPSGWVDKYYGIAAGGSYVYVEGQTSVYEYSMSTTTVCSGDSIQLDAGDYAWHHWSNGSYAQMITVHDGEHSVQVENQYGFLQTFYFVVTPAPEVTTNVETISPLCYGENSAAIFLSSSGMIEELEWSNGMTADSLYNIPAGDYSYQYIDSDGCEHSSTVLVTQPEPLVISYTVDNVCPGASTSAEVNATGGTGSYFFDWDNADPDSLLAGTYSVVVNDENFCSAMLTFEVEEYLPLLLSGEIEPASGGMNGSIMLNASGGLPPYSCDWSDGSSDAEITGIGQGIYTCVVTDAAGCTSDITLEVIDVGVEEIQAFTRVFPNPCTDILRVTSPVPVNVSVYDATGKMVHLSSLFSVHVIDVSSWSQGLYLVNVGGISTRLIRE